MNKNWKRFVLERAEMTIQKAASPLPAKEMAWQAIKFVVSCGTSNPLSFALRPLVMHSSLRRMVGVNLTILAVWVSVFAPIPSLAQDTGGNISIVVAPEGTISLSTEERIKFPLPERDMSQGFWLLHAGLDFRAPIGTPINPIMGGVVKETEMGRFGYGNKIVISHDGGYESLYAHLSKINVTAGEHVTTDTVIGETGNTGRSTGPHLHLEITENGRPINPLLILGNK